MEMCSSGQVVLCDWTVDEGVAEQSVLRTSTVTSYLTAGLGEIETEYVVRSAPVLMTVYRDRDGLEKAEIAVFDGTMVTRY